MSILIEPHSAVNSSKDQSQRLFTVVEYHKMSAAGIFGPEERLELIEGTILTMSPKSIKHAACNDRAARYLGQILGERAVVRNQNPIALKELSEPQPDLVLAIPEEERYFDHHPTPAEVLLIVEIAGSSLEYDLGAKSRLYANAGIRQYWVLNLDSNELMDHREPATDGYHSRHTYGAGNSLDLVAFPDTTICVSELLLPQG